MKEDDKTASADNTSKQKLNPADASGLTFSSFVMSLGMQALMQLGQMPSPDGNTATPDREAARQTIDILTILSDKTKGNLNTEESHLLEEVLHNVRVVYVRG